MRLIHRAKGNQTQLVRLVCLLWLLVAPAAAFAQTGAIVEEVVHSVSLEGNLLGDSPNRGMFVYLPPSYRRSPARRYPVVYLLHGLGGSYKQWSMNGTQWDLRIVMDRLIKQGKIQEMIVVMPDGSNKYVGSFYTNSVTTGNWEDFLTQDLVKYIDAKYRTLPQAASRAIAGHSMGGYGAIKLGMKHPDIYGVVYGLSPCCLGWAGEFSLENPLWKRTLSFKNMDELLTAIKAGREEDYVPLAFVGLAAAWSPDPDKLPLFVDYPVEEQGGRYRPVGAVAARWAANLPLAMVDQYRSNLSRLRGIAFDVGTQDEFIHIPLASRLLAQALKRNKIQYLFEEYEGTHNNKIPQRIENNFLPFVSRLLADQMSPPAHSFPRRRSGKLMGNKQHLSLEKPQAYDGL